MEKGQRSPSRSIVQGIEADLAATPAASQLGGLSKQRYRALVCNQLYERNIFLGGGGGEKLEGGRMGEEGSEL